MKNLGRRKIWQIEPGYLCAIVGTCLGRADLRRLKRKKVFALPASASDYEVHNVFAGIGDGKTAQARALQKVLDEKYASFIRVYNDLHSDDELWQCWQEDSRKDNVPGAFWAIMTHAEASAELVGRVYGECHMISFDTFTQQRSSSTVIRRLEQRLSQEERKSVRVTEKLQREQEKCARLRKEQKEFRISEREVKAELLAVKKERDALVRQIAKEKWQRELEKLKIAYKSLTEENFRLQNELKEAVQAVAEYRSEIELMQVRSEQLSEYAEFGFAQHANSVDSVDEIYAASGGCGEPCESCKDCGTEACMGPDLCGKMVLYVGGRSNMIHLYRQLVEERGGRFSHHDGGRENSRQQLPRLLSGADVVLCPVDCVSHDACKQVKRICKRYSKPFVMMRSSGVSALEKQLESVV